MGHKKRPVPKQSKHERRKLARATPAPFSAQAKGFTPIGTVPTVEVRPNLVDETDDDVRLQRFRPPKEELVKRHVTRGMKIMDIYEESPNGYELVGRAPVNDIPAAVDYYSKQLRQFTFDYPEEYAICHFNLAKLFALSVQKDEDVDGITVKLENALFHCKKTVEIFQQDSHPVMWAVVCVFMGQCYRRQVEVFSDRSFVAKRRSMKEAMQEGIDILNGTLMVFQQARPYVVEHAIANQELGWMYLVDLEYEMGEDAKARSAGESLGIARTKIDTAKELAISHFERALSLTEGIPRAKPGDKPRTWDPLDQSTHPLHIRGLLFDRSLAYFEGVCLYLIGRAFFDENHISSIEAYQQELKKKMFMRTLEKENSEVDDDDELLELMANNRVDAYDTASVLNKEEFLTPHDDAKQSYMYLIKSLSNRYLDKDSYFYVDAHDRVSRLILNNPRLVNADYEKPYSQPNDIHIVSVISHLKACLRSPYSDTSVMQMNLNFRIAQCNIYRVYQIADKVPPGESISSVFMKGIDSANVLLDVEKHMLYARQYVTAANSQSTADAYMFFYSCLKLAEYKMLYAGIMDDATIEQRETTFQQSIYYLLEAMTARPLYDNQDLHYVTCAQLCQMLMAGRKKHFAVLAYSRLLFTMSVLTNRAPYSPVNQQRALLDEIYKASAHLFYAANGTIEWEKKHAGPTSKPVELRSRGESGNPNASSPNMKASTQNIAAMTNQSFYSQYGGAKASSPGLFQFDQDQVLESSSRDGYAKWSFEKGAMDMTAVQHAAAIRLQRYNQWKAYEDDIRSGAAKMRRQRKIQQIMEEQLKAEEENMKGVSSAMLVAADDSKSVASNATSSKPKFKPTPPMMPRFPDLPPTQPTPGKELPVQGIPLGLHKKIVAGTVEGVIPGSGINQMEVPDLEHQVGADPKMMMVALAPPVELTHNPKGGSVQSSAVGGSVPGTVGEGSDDESEVSSVGEDMDDLFSPVGMNANELLQSTYYKTVYGGVIAGCGSDRGPYTYRKRKLLNIVDDTGDVYPSSEYYVAKESVAKLMDVKRDYGIAPEVAAELKRVADKNALIIAKQPKGRQPKKVAPTPKDLMTALERHNKQTELFGHEDMVVEHNTKRSEENEVEEDQEEESEGSDYYEEESEEESEEERTGFVSRFLGLFRRKSRMENYSAPPPTTNEKVYGSVEEKIVGMAVGGIKGVLAMAKATVEKVKTKKPPRIFGQVWGSKTALLYWVVSCRVARLHLVLRTDRLRTTRGARAQHILTTMIDVADKKLGYDYRVLQRKLEIVASNLIVPPANLRELSHRSMNDLKKLFNSQTGIARALYDYEILLFKNLKGSVALQLANPKASEGISKYDYFIPSISCCPTLSRDIKTMTITVDAAMENVSVFDTGSPKKKKPEEQSNQLALVPEEGEYAGGGGYENDSDISEDGRNQYPGDASTATGAAAAPNGKVERGLKVVGELTTEFIQSMDGTLDGVKAFFNQHLKADECMISWHLPPLPSQPLQVVLAWKDSLPGTEAGRRNFKKRGGRNTASMPSAGHKKARPHTRSFSSYASTASFAAGEREKVAEQARRVAACNEEGIVAGVVLEAASSDMDSMQIHYALQSFLDALHARPAPRRISMTTEALRNLSDQLSISELLVMVPGHVSALIMCGPPIMRLVPWHLLYIEIEQEMVMTDEALAELDEQLREEKLKLEEQRRWKKKSKKAAKSTDSLMSSVENPYSDGRDKAPVLVEIPLLERYSVRLGPSAPIFELTSNASLNIEHKVGTHLMYCMNGSPIVNYGSDALKKKPTKGPGKSKVVSKTAPVQSRVASAVGEDVDDESVRGASLELQAVATTWSADPDDSSIVSGIATAPEAWRSTPLIRSDIVDHLGGEDLVAKKKELRKYGKKKSKKVDRKKAVDVEDSDSSISSEESDDSEVSDISEADMDLETSHDPTISYINYNASALEKCRVLHICATQILQEKDLPLSMEEIKKKKQEAYPFASLQLPASKSRYFERQQNKAKGVHSAAMVSPLTSKDFVQQIYLPNCALCVLSRFGATDDIWDVKGTESNFEFIEAVHFAGATCVMYPLWGGLTQGSLGALGNTLMLIKFYADLAVYAGARQPIADACRGAQLWLRDVTARDAITYLKNSPLLPATRKQLISEISAYVNPAALKKKFGDLNTATNTTDLGDRKLFSHFLYWGSFCISGQTGNVHHPDVTAPDLSDAQLAAELNDEDGLDIEFERDILLQEGKIEEANLLTEQIKKNRIEAIKKKATDIQVKSAPVRKAFVDAVDKFDKMFLDQDPDPVEVSDSDEEHENNWRYKSPEYKGNAPTAYQTGADYREVLPLDARAQKLQNIRAQAQKREVDLKIQAEKDAINDAYLKKREEERKQKLAEYEAKLRAELAGDKYPTMAHLTKEISTEKKKDSLEALTLAEKAAGKHSKKDKRKSRKLDNEEDDEEDEKKSKACIIS